ncbi:hypothetical protein GCM10027018_22730 [Paenibacillus thermoaerophilus]
MSAIIRSGSRYRLNCGRKDKGSSLAAYYHTGKVAAKPGRVADGCKSGFRTEALVYPDAGGYEHFALVAQPFLRSALSPFALMGRFFYAIKNVVGLSELIAAY